MSAGIYQIFNSVNGKRYIGSAMDLSERWQQHLRSLRRHAHFNRYIMRAWDKYGAAAFEFKTLLICAPADLLMFEQRCLDGFKPEYNISPTAGSILGFRHAEASKKQMSAAQKGRTFTPEWRAKLSAARKGWIPSAETRSRMSLARKKHVMPPETRAKINASNTGKRRSPQFCADTSARQKGRVFTPETRAKMSASAKKRWGTFIP